VSESQGPQEKKVVVPPAAKVAQARAAAEAERRRQAQALDRPNPSWWAPVFVTLLLVGLLWIVVFYISQGQWPVRLPLLEPRRRIRAAHRRFRDDDEVEVTAPRAASARRVTPV